jgi:protein-disulfide isomerase
VKAGHATVAPKRDGTVTDTARRALATVIEMRPRSAPPFAVEPRMPTVRTSLGRAAHAVFLLLISGAACAAEARAGAETIATIAGQPVTRDALDAAIAVSVAAQQAEFERERRRLATELRRALADLRYATAERLVDEGALAAEAATTGRTAEALLADLKPATVTDADVRGFYDAQRAQIGQPLEAVAAPLRKFLEGEARSRVRREYLDALRVKHGGAVVMEPEREDVAPTGPARGPANAPVTIVEFGDLQCPYCARLKPSLAEVARRFPRDVRVVFRHLPLSGIHPQAQSLAEASVCAGAQGRFWEYHDAVYDRQGEIDDAFPRRLAAELGLALPAFDACVASPTTRATVRADAQAAEALDLSGTPVLFVNGRYMSGAQSPDAIARAVRDELRRRRDHARP